MKHPLLYGLAIAGVALGTACAPTPDPALTGRSPEEMRQLVAVTDSAVHLVRNLSLDNQTSLSQVQEAVRPVIAAVDGVGTQMQRHLFAVKTDSGRLGSSVDDQFDASAYSHVASCVRANNIELMDIERHVQRLNDSKLSGDEGAIEARRQTLIKMSQNAADCALLATENLRAVKSANAVEQIGLLTGESYAIATAFYTAAGLTSRGLLKRQIGANESILTRLSSKCDGRQQMKSATPITRVTYPCVSYALAEDALPKLKATLLHLDSGSPLQASHVDNTPDELGQFRGLTDHAVSLLGTLRATKDSSVERDAAIQQIAVDIDTVDDLLLHQAAESRISDSVDAMTYAKTRACVESNVILFAALKPLVQRLYEAQQSGNAAAIKAQRGLFGQRALDSSACYFQSIAFFNSFSDLNAVNDMGMVVGEMYAVNTALATLGGFSNGPAASLRHQIEANEAIVARLASRCENTTREAQVDKVTDSCAAHRLAQDALPKLRSAKSLVDVH